MADSVVEPSRNSQLNRTMVISKRNNRPGLPQINDNDPCLSEPICAPANLEAQQRVHFRSSGGGGSLSSRSHARSLTVTVQSETMQEFQNAFDEIEQIQISDKEKLSELRRRILALVDTTEKQWNAQQTTNNEKQNDENRAVGEKLELNIAKQAAMYADKFFKICERNGIDVEKVLKEDPDTVFNMKLKSTLPTPSTAVEQSKEIETLRKERDNLMEELKGIKASYSSLFKSYDKLNLNHQILYNSRNLLAETATKQREAMTAMYENALNLKSIMLEQAAVADNTIATTKGHYDSATVTIRMDLAKLANENSSLKSEIESKNREIDELRRIVQEIVKQVSLEPV